MREGSGEVNSRVLGGVMDLETGNYRMVAVRGDRIAVLLAYQELSKAEALNLAAWLVALADDDDEFPELLDAVQGGLPGTRSNHAG